MGLRPTNGDEDASRIKITGRLRSRLGTERVLPRWNEKAGPQRDAISSQLETHSKCKRRTGHEAE